MQANKPGCWGFVRTRRVSLVVALFVAMSIAAAVAQGPWTTPPGTSGKIRVVSTAADALCVGGSGSAPASSACTGGIYAGPVVANTGVTIVASGLTVTTGPNLQDYTLYSADHSIGANETNVAFSGAHTATLPTCNQTGRFLHVFSTSAVTTISGTTSPTLTTLNSGDAIGFLCNGSGTWFVE